MEFRILGPLEVDDRGRRLPLRGPRQRALLASLLLARGRDRPEDRLLDEVWRGEPPPSGGAALRVRISQLRKALAATAARPALTTRPPGYVLEVDAGQVDALRFERLLGAGTRAAGRRRRRCGRDDAARGARALARPGAGRVRGRTVRRGRERQARGAAHRGGRGADQGRALARPAPRARRRARRARRRASVPRAAARAADAGALPLGPAGGGARGVPRRTERLRRGARDRADPPAPGPGAEDPPPGRVPRRARATRPQAVDSSGRGAQAGDRPRRGARRLPEDSDPERSSALLERFRDSATDEIEAAAAASRRSRATRSRSRSALRSRRRTTRRGPCTRRCRCSGASRTTSAARCSSGSASTRASCSRAAGRAWRAQPSSKRRACSRRPRRGRSSSASAPPRPPAHAFEFGPPSSATPATPRPAASARADGHRTREA